MSLFLFRKVLPSSAPDLNEFLDKMAVPSEEPDHKFMDYIRRRVPRMFPKGWDRNYCSAVESAVVSTSACSEKSRSKGGARMYWIEKGIEEGRKEFCAYLRGEERVDSVPPSRLEAVATGGKVRLLSVPSAKFQLCLPFHKIFYDKLSRFPWLLRGDAKASRFSNFTRVDGEVFVSGDYESATDNLNHHIQKLILELVLDGCENVPDSIKELAFQTLDSELITSGRKEKVLRGQMMGMPISFPLLCLVNRLAFEFATRDYEAPCLINGDDIVFRSRPEVAKKWADSVGRSGLKLSVGKTLVDRSIFTLNSTLFGAGEFRVRAIPFIRSKALFGTDEGFLSIAGRYDSFAPSFGKERRFVLRNMFLRHNIGYIESSRRSLNRGLQMNVPEPLLKSSRLFKREADYLSLPKEKVPPPKFSQWRQPPKGFRLNYSEERKILTKEEKKEIAAALVDAAWCGPITEEQLIDLVDGGINRSKKINFPSMARLIKCGVSELKERILADSNRIVRDYFLRRRRLYPFWEKEKDPKSVADDTDFNQDEKVVCRLRGSLYRAVNPVSSLSLVKATVEQKVVVFDCGGVGIGPPPLY
jgi:hypothetical protein